jgi:hypothetical protein
LQLFVPFVSILLSFVWFCFGIVFHLRPRSAYSPRCGGDALFSPPMTRPCAQCTFTCNILTHIHLYTFILPLSLEAIAELSRANLQFSICNSPSQPPPRLLHSCAYSTLTHAFI